MPFNSNIKSIDVSNNLLLENLQFYNCNVSEIDVSMLPNLTNIYFGNWQPASASLTVNTITSIDLSNKFKRKLYKH